MSTEPSFASEVSVDPFPSLGDLLVGGGPRNDATTRAREQAYEAGFAEGRSEGFEQGFAEGRVAAAQRAETVLDSLADSISRACAGDEAVARSMSDAILNAAMAIAEAVIGHDVRCSESPGLDAMRRAFNLVPMKTSAVARLHPDDALLIQPDDLTQFGSREIEIVADPSVQQGGCMLDLPSGRIDATLSDAIIRVREALAGTNEENEL